VSACTADAIRSTNSAAAALFDCIETPSLDWPWHALAVTAPRSSGTIAPCPTVGHQYPTDPAGGSTPFPLEEKAQLESGCEKGIPLDFFASISKADEYLAFTKDAGPRTAEYVVAVMAGAWAVGFCDH